MSKLYNGLLFVLSAFLLCSANSSQAASHLSLSPNIYGDLNNAKQYAKVSFLPSLVDSEPGFGNRGGIGGNHNIGENCVGYNYTKNSCPNNQDARDNCPFDAKKYKECFCNTYKYAHTIENCSYYKSGQNIDKLLNGTICKNAGDKKFGQSCGCTAMAFPYISNTSCPTGKIVDNASYCKNATDTRYEKCKCNKEIYDLTTQKNSYEGWTCEKCTDDYADQFQCTVTACPFGSSTSREACGSNEDSVDAGYMSGGKACYKCQSRSNCNFFKNSDGTINIPESACAWDAYGHSATVNVPNGKSYSSAWIRMWGNSSVNGEFSTATLIPGLVISNGGAYKDPRTITYNDRVTVNGVIRIEPGVTTVVFKKGVCGNFKCEQWVAENKANTMTKVKDLAYGESGCPTPASDCSNKCNNYFVNSDGAITIPNNQCGWDAYGQTANIRSGTPKNDEYENVWIRMWGSVTVTNPVKTKNLISGVAVSNAGYWDQKRSYTFKDKVTISGVLKTDPDITTTNFDGGIEGNFTCESWTGTGGNGMKKVADIQPGQKGCPCSQSRFTYDADNCTGTLSGASCGGKFETCKAADDNLDTMCAEVTMNPDAKFCGGMDPYGTQKPTCYNSSGSSEYAFMHNNGRTCWSCDEGYTLRCSTSRNPVQYCDAYKNDVCIECYMGTLTGGKCVIPAPETCSTRPYSSAGGGYCCKTTGVPENQAASGVGGCIKR